VEFCKFCPELNDFGLKLAFHEFAMNFLPHDYISIPDFGVKKINIMIVICMSPSLVNVSNLKSYLKRAHTITNWEVQNLKELFIPLQQNNLCPSGFLESFWYCLGTPFLFF